VPAAGPAASASTAATASTSAARPWRVSHAAITRRAIAGGAAAQRRAGQPVAALDLGGQRVDHRRERGAIVGDQRRQLRQRALDLRVPGGQRRHDLCRNHTRVNRGSAFIGSRHGSSPAAATYASISARVCASSGRTNGPRRGAIAARPSGPVPRSSRISTVSA
jgi:hypothetical protein